ncbi:het-E-1 heterokaryon incompatibility protein [Fusarium denticulatum]|uniref:Het-E-1 heterokaryon incompatibility protein n=1 Tax=Fusarium denticulatum TaxID=48507 RepID=A0A8H5UFI6_9HYPO|nr:het-E-1 heterokaryon incompatibility protein [Fusarium denticulatum]
MAYQPQKRRLTLRNDPDHREHKSKKVSLTSYERYTIAWICALPKETAAAEAVLDDVHERLSRHKNDTNSYILGSIGCHNIVIACLPINGYGTNNAANVLTHLTRTFTSIYLSLMVGIGGGVPRENYDIRLGDIVVGTQLVQHDLMKIGTDGQIQHTAVPRTLSHLVGKALSVLRSAHQPHSSRIPLILQEKFYELPNYARPSTADRLFRATYQHSSQASSCAECSPSELVQRCERSSNDPYIHYGTIASGNQVIKDSTVRDNVAQELNAICFEMEAAGLPDIGPCLSVRGICDYSDSHKSKEWQEYAAATAAAFAREFLEKLPPTGEMPTNTSESFRQQEYWLQNEKYNKCLRDLRETDPRDDKSRIEATKGGLLEDAYRWILKNDKFQEWYNASQKQLLWIKGDPGKGKTMLLCGLINELEKEQGNFLSYFFCQATEARLSNATAVLRGLIYLLLVQRPPLISYIEEKYDHAGKQLFEDVNAWQALSKIFMAMLEDPILDGVLLIVDALDECITDQEKLLDLIIRCSNVKWIVTSRNWPEIEQVLDGFTQKVRLHLELNQDSVSKAVEAFIEWKVEELAKKKHYDEKLQSDVKSYLAKNSDGTFLWVALVCQGLSDNKVLRKRHTRLKLDEFPQGLEPLYGRMMVYISSLPDAEICREILALASVVYRPVTLTELKTLLGSQYEDEDDDLQEIIRCCGSFLILRGDTIYFLHQSAKDFLVKKALDQISPSGLAFQHGMIFERSLQALSKTLRRDICELGRPGFKVDDVSSDILKPMDPIGYSCIYWVDHLHDSEHTRLNDSLTNGGDIHVFLQKKYLYWLEALGLLSSTVEGVKAMYKLEDLATKFNAPDSVTELLQDARRFILAHKRSIEIAPLQAYASGLVFSPECSLIRVLFEHEATDDTDGASDVTDYTDLSLIESFETSLVRPNVALLSALMSIKDEVVSRVVRRVQLTASGQGARQHVSGEASAQFVSQDSETNSSNNSSQHYVPNARKRFLGGDEGYEAGDGDDGKERRTREDLPLALLPSHRTQKFACPFYKRYPEIFFEYEKELTEHARAEQRCDNQLAPAEEEIIYITQSQERALRKRQRNIPQEERWALVFQVVFPNIPPDQIPSPYYRLDPADLVPDAAALAELRAFAVQELPSRIISDVNNHLRSLPGVTIVGDQMASILRDTIQKVLEEFSHIPGSQRHHQVTKSAMEVNSEINVGEISESTTGNILAIPIDPLDPSHPAFRTLSIPSAIPSTMHDDCNDVRIESETDNQLGDSQKYSADVKDDAFDEESDQQIRSAKPTAAVTTGLEESSESIRPLRNECTPEMFRCVTDSSDSTHILSARVGYSRRENGRRLLPRWKPGSVITYSIDVDSFPSQRFARFAKRALDKAAGDWNSRDVGIQFQSLKHEGQAVFALKYYPAPNGLFAESFFPDSKRRTLGIFRYAFKKQYRKFMANIFRHELGHVLGLRHEEAGTMESKIPSVALSPPNSQSIMRYFRDPSSLCIQDSDIAAVRKLCAIEGEQFEGFLVITVDPGALDDTSLSGSDQLSSRGSGLVSSETGSFNRASTEGQPPRVGLDGETSVDVTSPQTTPTVGRPRAPPITIEMEANDNNPEQVQPPEDLLQESHSTTDLPQNSSFLAVPAYHRISSPPQPEEESLRPDTDQSDTKHDPRPVPFQLDVQDALTPDMGFEDKFAVENNPFAFSPGQLGKMFNPKSHSAFYALGGLHGLEKGLRTDRTAGLSMDETALEGMVSFEEAANEDASKYGALGEKAPQLSHSEYRTQDAFYTPRGDDRQFGSDAAYSDRKRVFGTNRTPGPSTKSLPKIVFDVYCGEWLLILLTIVAMASTAWGIYEKVAVASHENHEPIIGPAYGIAILVCIIVFVCLETSKQWITHRCFERLGAMNECRPTKVVRSGRTIEVSNVDLLVGDVVLLSAGDMVPIDGILIDGYGLKFDESCCTGESDTIRKTPGDQVFTVLDDAINGSVHGSPWRMDPFIMSGSKVLEGIGSVVATAVGTNSTYGQIRMCLRETDDLSLFRRKLQTLSTSVVRKLGIAVGVLLFVVCTTKFLATLPSSTLPAEKKGRNYLDMSLLAVALSLVAAAPFSFNVGSLTTIIITWRLRKRNNSIRLRRNGGLGGYGRACEVAADTTTICTGKTGLLTQDRMRVVAVTLGNFKGYGNQPSSIDSAVGESSNNGLVDDTNASFAQSLSPEEKQLLVRSIAINSTAYEGDVDGEHKFIGFGIETALLTFGREILGLGYLEEERSNAVVEEMLPFTPHNMFMSTMVKLPNGKFRVYVKGAPEVLFTRCSKVIGDTNPDKAEISTRDLNDATRKLYYERATTYASRSLRTIALCFQDFTCQPSLDVGVIYEGMTLLAICGLEDPIRDGVVEAIRTCHGAGITVRIMTGDNVETARAVAKKNGILQSDGIIMEGPVFRSLDRYSQNALLPHLMVLARASPEDKRLFVKLLKLLGETVAVASGSAQDAPALKIADTGFAKGINGSDIAVEASDVVLMDDSFGSIVLCIFWGRAAKDSIARFMQFKLTAICSASILAFVSAAAANLSDRTVLNAAQLLWVGLVTDMSVFALLVSWSSQAIRERKPSPQSHPFITLPMVKMMEGQLIGQLLIMLLVYFGWFKTFGKVGEPITADDRTKRNTFTFNTFVWLQIFNIINPQPPDKKFNVFKGSFGSPFLLPIGFLAAVGQVLIVFYGGQAFGTSRLKGTEWAISVVLGSSSLFLGVLLRLLPDVLVDKLMPEFLKRRQLQRGPSLIVD